LGPHAGRHHDEIAFRAAINVLRDSIESGRMPGQPLAPDAAVLHERSVEHLEALLRRVGAGSSRDAAARCDA